MSTEEYLDPVPDSFILQPPVFHPVSKHNKTTNQLNSSWQVIGQASRVLAYSIRLFWDGWLEEWRWIAMKDAND